MRGMIGGIVTGGLVSVFAVSVISVVSETPAGVTPPEFPLVEAPLVDVVPVPETAPETAGVTDAISTPVGSLTIEEPQAPALPDSEATLTEQETPVAVQTQQVAPQADTDPLDEPEVVSIEGGLAAPEISQTANLQSGEIYPVLPNPQSVAPATPVTEANLTVSTAPATPVIVVDPQEEATVEAAVEPAQEDTATDETPSTNSVIIQGTETQEVFIVAEDVDAPTVPEGSAIEDGGAIEDQTPDEEITLDTLNDGDSSDGPVGIEDATPDAEAAPDIDDGPTRVIAGGSGEPGTATPSSRFQLQSDGNTVLGSQNTGATVRRFGDSSTPQTQTETAPAGMNALSDYAAPQIDTAERPMLSFVLIDDGSMSAASVALAALPFDVTIALNPSTQGATDMLDAYRADGFEVTVLAKLPADAVPSDVEITFESVFSDLPETIAVLDIGDGGYQTNRDVTEQAMEILASQGRGFVTAGAGLNMAGRAAELAGVPSVVIFRDLDAEDQDARVVRRFVDQAAFRARQESGVILVGRVRPDTISALILWAAANQNDQVAIVPLSTVLNAK